MPTPHRCDPKLFEKDLTGQVIICTGANSGIGLETTRQLTSQNATVILACRNEEKANVAMKDIGNADKTFYIHLDLSDLDSVRSFVDTFTSKYDRLDILINNAGVMMCPYAKTKQGFELQIGSNHLAHFLLFQLLTPILIKTAEETGKPSRFITVSSCAAAACNLPGMTSTDPEIDFDDLNWEKKKYDQSAAYAQSKLANYLTALEASHKYESSKLISASLHPGWVQSNLDQHVISNNFFGNMLRKLFLWSGKMINAVDGAQTTLFCILNDAKSMESGAFYSQLGVYKEKDATKGGWPIKLPNPKATDEVASKLWVESEKLVNP
uniref:Protochlorophyllide reductase n=1 Tax=Ditylum brightwellii TaxID=49249 RepID=A0A6U4AFA3_9STRA|mmetsp:Transcript_35557/g.53002  ORF Transcript_35557/g.53002 Transcript_35557/m.53002 type:complete len:324 (+) Transcript_35557:50-1021(+)